MCINDSTNNGMFMSFAHFLARLIAYKSDSSHKVDFSKELRIQFSIAFVFLSLALTAYLTSGYHAYFIELNTFFSIMPERFWQVVTFLGECNCAFAIVLFFVFKKPKLAVNVFWAAILAAIITHLMKNGFDAMRPAGVISTDSFHQLGDIVTKNSFPSGHTITIFVMASTFCYNVTWKYKTVLLFSIATLVGFSRVAVGAHWPIDVLVGGGTGILISTCAYVLLGKLAFCTHKASHVIAYVILLGSAISLFTHTGGYELAKEMAILIAFASLLFFTYQSSKIILGKKTE